jgi:transcriptional regulator with XRE-family HTH domain
VEPHDIFNSIDLGEAIRFLRRERNWSQSDLASWLGVSRPTVIKLERGNSNLSLALRAVTLLGAVPTLHLKADSLQRRSAT